ncbi:MAG: caspase family protein [Limnohabitans sp.]
MKRTALVIGNANYPTKPLKNPANDAEDMAARLKSFGFIVHMAIDCSNLKMEQELNNFRDELYDSDVGLFFFAGHGVQINEANYLLAIDTNFDSELTAKHTSLKLDLVIGTMERAPTTTSIVILDACRDNPWQDRWRSTAGPDLAPVYAPRGTLVAFGTSPGQRAKDGKGRNGAYTAALLQHIGATDCSVETMFKRVRNTLSAVTAENQISWEHTSLAGEFFFNLEVDVKVGDYSPAALRDSALELDETQKSHRLIKSLKWAAAGSVDTGLSF